MKRGQVDEATRRALHNLDQWNDVTGFLPDNSYRYEIEAIVEDAVHIGIQMAIYGNVQYDDGNVVRTRSEAGQGEGGVPVESSRPDSSTEGSRLETPSSPITRQQAEQISDAVVARMLSEYPYHPPTHPLGIWCYPADLKQAILAAAGEAEHPDTARLRAVREVLRSIAIRQLRQNSPYDDRGPKVLCGACHATWYPDEDEQHTADCPAAPPAGQKEEK